MRSFLKTIGIVTALLAFATAIIALVTEGVKFYREMATPDPVTTLPTTPAQTGNSLANDVEIEIDSTQGWQSSGVYVEKGTTITLKVIKGTWTGWKGHSPYSDGAGTGYVCAEQISASQCVEPLPNVSSDSLIGQIGDFMFTVGNGDTLISEQAGEIYLRINDGGDLSDNDGKLRVKISVQD